MEGTEWQASTLNVNIRIVVRLTEGQLLLTHGFITQQIIHWAHSMSQPLCPAFHMIPSLIPQEPGQGGHRVGCKFTPAYCQPHTGSLCNTAAGLWLQPDRLTSSSFPWPKEWSRWYKWREVRGHQEVRLQQGIRRKCKTGSFLTINKQDIYWNKDRSLSTDLKQTPTRGHF
jgi:hypothetical protein